CRQAVRRGRTPAWHGPATDCPYPAHRRRLAGGATMSSTRSSVDDLRLKSGPRPVTRINRRLLILVAALLLSGIALLVLVALQPPSWRTETSPELVTVEN